MRVSAAPHPDGADASVRTIRKRLIRLPGHHISPQGLDLRSIEQIAPRRHLVLAARHRGDEAFMLVGRKFAQIEGTFGVLHAGTVARRAIAREDCGARPDALRWK